MRTILIVGSPHAPLTDVLGDNHKKGRPFAP